MDDEQRELVANNTIVANGRYFGGGMQIAADALPDDGLLDAIVFGDVGRLDLALNMHRLYRGTILRHPKASHRLARAVSVETATSAADRDRRRAAGRHAGPLRGACPRRCACACPRPDAG